MSSFGWSKGEVIKRYMGNVALNPLPTDPTDPPDLGKRFLEVGMDPASPGEDRTERMIVSMEPGETWKNEVPMVHEEKTRDGPKTSDKAPPGFCYKRDWSPGPWYIVEETDENRGAMDIEVREKMRALGPDKYIDDPHWTRERGLALLDALDEAEGLLKVKEEEIQILKQLAATPPPLPGANLPTFSQRTLSPTSVEVKLREVMSEVESGLYAAQILFGEVSRYSQESPPPMVEPPPLPTLQVPEPVFRGVGGGLTHPKDKFLLHKTTDSSDRADDPTIVG